MTNDQHFTMTLDVCVAFSVYEPVKLMLILVRGASTLNLWWDLTVFCSVGPWRLHLKQLLFTIVATLSRDEGMNTPKVFFLIYAAVDTCDLWMYSDPIRGNLKMCENSTNNFVSLESDPIIGRIFFFNSRLSRISLINKTPFIVISGSLLFFAGGKKV